MIKEIKYILFIVTIISFIFFTIKYYYSDDNIKNSFRSLESHSIKIDEQSKKIKTLMNDTENIIEYVDKNQNPKQEKFHFWKLIYNNDS
tara:strand:+ start:822 stop:1088 length:267 start_codon:yes stop_codon:yes gene_type:complete